MSLNPANSAWIAGKAIDGNTNQNYTSNSCAITDIPHHHTNNESVWWKVWLDRPFNVAYLEIFFESKGNGEKERERELECKFHTVLAKYLHSV